MKAMMASVKRLLANKTAEIEREEREARERKEATDHCLKLYNQIKLDSKHHIGQKSYQYHRE